MKEKIAIWIIALFLVFDLKAQDPQFTQFYSSTVSLNPAFAGATEDFRFQSTYRNQWPGIPANYVSTAFALDKNLSHVNSGAAFIFSTDKAGTAGLSNNELGFAYAYKLNLSRKWGIRVGSQLSLHSLNFDFSKLTFGDQLDSRGKIFSSTSDDAINNGINYFSFSTGALLYSKKFWLGFAGRNLNEPNQSLYGEEPSNVPPYFSIHGGLEIPLTRRMWKNQQQVKMVPVFHYKSQGRFDQLDFGAYLQYQNTAFGLMYRGLPLKRYDRTEGNHDALALFMGFRVYTLKIGYSYDLTVSKLRAGTGGAHELTLVYEFEFPPGKGRVKPKKKSLSCPDFLK